MAEAIVGLVSAVWGASYVLQFVVHGYVIDPSINSVFGAIVGGALALSKQSKNNDNKKAPASTEAKD
jgi:hypothetical protein